MKSLFAKTDNSFFLSKIMFFIMLSCFIVLISWDFFNLVKITQLQFDWD